MRIIIFLPQLPVMVKVVSSAHNTFFHFYLSHLHMCLSNDKSIAVLVANQRKFLVKNISLGLRMFLVYILDNFLEVFESVIDI